MKTIEEIITWKVADLHDLVKLELANRGLVLGSEEVYHLMVTDSEGVTVWEDSSFDERSLLLSLYGWLIGHKKASNPAWERRAEAPPVYRAQTAPTTKVTPFSDPGDLNPSEILEIVRQQRRNT